MSKRANRKKRNYTEQDDYGYDTVRIPRYPYRGNINQNGTYPAITSPINYSQVQLPPQQRQHTLVQMPRDSVNMGVHVGMTDRQNLSKRGQIITITTENLRLARLNAHILSVMENNSSRSKYCSSCILLLVVVLAVVILVIVSLGYKEVKDIKTILSS